MGEAEAGQETHEEKRERLLEEFAGGVEGAVRRTRWYWTVGGVLALGGTAAVVYGLALLHPAAAWVAGGVLSALAGALLVAAGVHTATTAMAQAENLKQMKEAHDALSGLEQMAGMMQEAKRN